MSTNKYFLIYAFSSQWIPSVPNSIFFIHTCPSGHSNVMLKPTGGAGFISRGKSVRWFAFPVFLSLDILTFATNSQEADLYVSLHLELGDRVLLQDVEEVGVAGLLIYLVIKVPNGRYSNIIKARWFISTIWMQFNLSNYEIYKN